MRSRANRRREGQIHLTARPSARTLALLVVALALLAVAHAGLIAGTALLVRVLAQGPLAGLAEALPFDPVYTRALFQFLGQAGVRGVAVVGPPGEALHDLLPALFAAPGRMAPAALAVPAYLPGTTMVAKSIARVATDAALLGVGFLLVRSGASWTVRRTLGALLLAEVVLAALRNPLGLAQLEAAGFSFAVGVLLPALTGRRLALSDLVAPLPFVARHLTLTLLTLALAVLLAAAVLGPLLLVLAGARRLAAGAGRGRLRHAAPALLLVALGAGLWPAGAQADASQVEVAGERYQYRYFVNGSPEYIRGMGYNVEYAGLTPEERASRYDRDFALIAAAGANTILGWATEEFDELTLEKAAEHGLGVILPYDLDPEADYANPDVRAAITADVLAWVQRFQGYPALRMWGIGNEVLHKLQYPSWLHRRGDPEREARADAFAAFLVELIDQVHALDPDHPVVYRDAEEAYLERVAREVWRSGLHRPWFVYGTNTYTPRLKEILEAWPQLGLDAALLVSEFAPGGYAPEDRPYGFQQMWATIQQYPDWVIGGAVYTWTTEGPEEVDRVFGLVDGEGNPTDDSLATIGELYRADAAARQASGATPDSAPPASEPTTRDEEWSDWGGTRQTGFITA